MARPIRLALLAGFALLACSPAPSGEGFQAPDFELNNLDGKTVRLSDFHGKPVLLDFWATWCGPCRISIPTVQAFYDRYKDDGLVVLGINTDEDPSGVYAFVKRLKMTYPVLFGGNTRVPYDYRVEGIPLFILLDQEGRVVRRYEGFSPDITDYWETDLKPLLKQPA